MLPGKEHFSSGPVGGFAVRDLAAAVDELSRAGVELLGKPGPTWQHFRGPDGNAYELVAAERLARALSVPGAMTGCRTWRSGSARAVQAEATWRASQRCPPCGS